MVDDVWWILDSGFWMLLIWGAIIALAVWGIRAFTSRRDEVSQNSEPLEIARRRYAEGEITKEQFEELRVTLIDAVV
jgi:putative membrane protein